MGIDPFSPLAPARVRVLVLPCGKITSRRFNAFVEALQLVSAVRLGDLPLGGQDEKHIFSPAAFPDGRVHLHIASTAPPPGYASLAPFELFRRTMVIIGTVDAQEYENIASSEDTSAEDGADNVVYRRAHDGFISAMENAQDQHNGALLTQLIVMDAKTKEKKPWIPQGALHTTTTEHSDVVGTVHEVVRRFLHELAGWTEQMKSWTTVTTPVVPTNQGSRMDLDRKARLRMSELSQVSRDGSVSSDGLSRPQSRHLSQAIRSPSPSLTDSPRPDSPPSRSDTPSSPDRSSATESPVIQEDPKARQRLSKAVTLNTSNPEKMRNVGKARVGIMSGTLHMMAGQWSTAWRELIEHTNKVRSLHDYMWAAIGVERILVCALLLGSGGFGFQIHPVCINADRQSSIPFIDNNRDSTIEIGAKDLGAAKSSLRKLGASISSIGSTILTYFDRAGSYGTEELAPIAFSELILRLAKLQSCLLVGTDSIASDPIFAGESLDSLRRPSDVKGPLEVSRLTICDMVMRAFPQPYIDLEITNRCSILGSLASVLSLLGLHRKRAIVLKELTHVLTPPLQQARKLGAAEFGIHPSSNISYASTIQISSGQGDAMQSMEVLLQHLQSSYAILESGNDPRAMDETATPGSGRSDYKSLLDGITMHLARLANLDYLGSMHLKFDILRSSIDFCEALPDPSGAACNVALLLAISGPQRPITPSRRERQVRLGIDEQMRLANLIAAIDVSARDAGISGALPHYWDKFLVRNIRLAETQATGRLTEHQKEDMAADGTKSLFLYDPFAKTGETTRKENIIVAGELSPLAVMLQNPFDFEIEIERIDFVLEEGELAVAPGAFMLGPRRLQEIVVQATANQAGALKIVACKIKIAGCRDDTFAIYKDDWRVDAELKVKEPVKPVETSATIDRALANQMQKLPAPWTMDLAVIGSQPFVIVEGVDLKHQAVMLLEGERATFRITIRNASESVDVDFLHVSFEDSLTNALRTSLASKSISRAELYEIEFELAQNPIFTWKRLHSDKAEFIQAGASAEFEISVLGRPGVRDARVFFDFGHVGSAETTTRFHTRQVAVDINISVNQCIEVQHFDVVRLSRALVTDSQDHAARRECLLVFDIRNIWQRPLEIQLQPGENGNEMLRKAKQSRVILPMQSTRFTLPIERLYVKNPQAQIPWISSQSRRQFVVSSSGDAGQQRGMREQFWYREAFFRAVKCTWRDLDSDRQGMLSLRNMRLSGQLLAALRAEDVDIDCSVTSKESSVRQTGGSSFEVKARSFLSFQVRLANRSDKGIHAMLRMLPMMANQGSEAGSDAVSRRLVWSGVLQRPLPVIEPGQSRTVELGLCALSAGAYSIGVVVEEVRPALAREPQQGAAATDDDLDEAAKQTDERRVWRAPDVCSITAI